LPELENVGPEGWRAAVLAEMGPEPVILIGHSLGAAICMDVARTHAVASLVLLACPPFLPDFTPQPPPDTGISAATLRRIARFVRNVCDNAAQVSVRSVHFVGELDRWAPCEQARRLPFPLVVIPGAGHGLNRSTLLARRLAEFLA
jgi:pimeloyl-ACP methyl ester carboxylesterase